MDLFKWNVSGRTTYKLIIEPDNTATISAKGGSISFTSTLITYRNKLEQRREVVSAIYEGESPGFSISKNKVIAENRGTIVGDLRSITVTASYIIKKETVISNSVIVYQEENELVTSAYHETVVDKSIINRMGGSFSLSGKLANTYTSNSTEIVDCPPKYNALPSWITLSSTSDPNNVLFYCGEHSDLTWDKRNWDAGYNCVVTQNGYYLARVLETPLATGSSIFKASYKLYSPDESISMPTIFEEVPLTLYISNIDRCNPDRIDRVNLSLQWNGAPVTIRYEVEEGDECTDYTNVKTYVFYDRPNSSGSNNPRMNNFMLSISTGPIRTISNSGLRLTESGSLKLIR